MRTGQTGPVRAELDTRSIAPAARRVGSSRRVGSARRVGTRWVVLLGAALLLLVVLAAPAGAHATLTEMSPGAEERLTEPPERVVLRFSEDVSADEDSVRVFDPSATEVRGIEVGGDGPEVVATLPELDADGSYTVTWRVVSADGHSIRGAYLFHLREATLTEPVDAGGAGSSLPADIFRGIGAVLAVAGLVVCAGSVLSEAHRPLPRWWGLRWVPVLAGTSLLLGGAVVAVGASMSRSLEVALSTVSGRSAAVAVLLAVAGLVGSVLPVGRALELLLLAGVGVTVALQGHAVAVAPVALSGPATLVHVAAAVLWAAGLFRLEHLSRTAPELLPAAVRRFSPWAFGAVVALAATGVLLVLDRVPLDELVTTNYGRLGVTKVLVLVCALVLAWRNRSVGTDAEAEPDASALAAARHERELVGAGTDGPVRATAAPAAPADAELADTGPTDARPADAEAATVPVPAAAAGALRQGVRAEMVVLAAALVLGAVLAQVPPPGEGGDSVAGGYFAERATFGPGDVELTIDPGRRGTNEVHVTALGADGRLMPEADELHLSFVQPEEGVGPIEPEMQRIAAGHSTTFVRLPLEGTWEVTVTSRVDRFTELSATFEVPIGGS